MHFTLHVHESRLYARFSFHSGASLLFLTKDIHGHGLPSLFGETADKGTSRIKVGVPVAGQASVVLSSLSLSLKSFHGALIVATPQSIINMISTRMAILVQ